MTGRCPHCGSRIDGLEAAGVDLHTVAPCGHFVDKTPIGELLHGTAGDGNETFRISTLPFDANGFVIPDGGTLNVSDGLLIKIDGLWHHSVDFNGYEHKTSCGLECDQSPWDVRFSPADPDGDRCPECFPEAIRDGGDRDADPVGSVDELEERIIDAAETDRELGAILELLDTPIATAPDLDDHYGPVTFRDLLERVLEDDSDDENGGDSR